MNDFAKKSKKTAAPFIFVTACLLHAVANSQTKPSNDYLQSFLNLKNDPKALGAGGTYLALGSEISSLFWNPGTLPEVSSLQTSFFYGRHKENIKWASIGIGQQGWGLGLIGLVDTDLPLPSLVKNPPHRRSVNFGGLGRLASGFKLNKLLNAGLAIKPMVVEWNKISTAQDTIRETVYGASADLGFYARLGNRANFGIVVQDAFDMVNFQRLGSKREHQRIHLPAKFRAGIGITPANWLKFSLDTDGIGQEATYHLGISARPEALPFSLWAGTFGHEDELKNWHALNWSTGFGVRLFGQEFNYAVLEEAGFSPSHLVGASVNLSKPTRTIDADSVYKNLPMFVKAQVDDLVLGNETDSRIAWQELRNADWEKLNKALSTIESHDFDFTYKINKAFARSRSFSKNVVSLLDASYEDRSQLLVGLKAQAPKEDPKKSEPLIAMGEQTRNETLNQSRSRRTNNQNSAGPRATRGSRSIPRAGVADTLFQENFYTYRPIYFSSKDFLDSLESLKAQLQTAEQERPWGFRETPEYWVAPPVKNNDWLYHTNAGRDKKTDRALLDMNGDGRPDYVVSTDEFKQKRWIIFFNEGGSFSNASYCYFKDTNNLMPAIAYLNDSAPPIARATIGSEEIFVFTRTFDVDGDSLPDVVMSPGKNASYWIIAFNQIPVDSSFHVRRWSLPERTRTAKEKEDQFGISYADGRHTTTKVSVVSETIDMTGDGIADWVYENRVENERGYGWKIFKGYKNGNTCGFSELNEQFYWEMRGAQDAYRYPYDVIDIFHTPQYFSLTFDFNNDRKPDHLFTRPNYDKYYLWKNTGTDFSDRNELLVPSPNVKIKLLNHEGGLKSGLLFCGYQINNNIYKDFVDINGDSLPDFVSVEEAVKGWTVFLNEGGERFGPEMVFQTNRKLIVEGNDEKTTGKTIDMNGDGYVDYVQTVTDGAPWEIYLNTTGGEKRYQNLREAMNMRELQVKLLEAHEAYFHEEYMLALKKYQDCLQAIQNHLGTDENQQRTNTVSMTRRLGTLEDLSPQGQNSRFDAFPEGALKPKSEILERKLQNISGLQRDKPIYYVNSQNQKKITLARNVKERMVYEQTPVFDGRDINVFDKNAPESIDENIYQIRIEADRLEKVVLEGIDYTDPQRFALYLRHFLNFILPLCIGDTHLELGNFEQAEFYYAQAARYEYLNLPIEARLLWLKFAELHLRWGDYQYKSELRNPAKQNYVAILQSKFAMLESEGNPNPSTRLGLESIKNRAFQQHNGIRSLARETEAILARNNSAASLSNNLNRMTVSSYLDSTNLENPLVQYYLMRAHMDTMMINQGLNFLGLRDDLIPIWRYSYLRDVARNLSQHAIQSERDHVNFKVTAENESYTIQQLLQSISLGNSTRRIDDAKMDMAIAELVLSKLNQKAIDAQLKAAKDQLKYLKDQRNRTDFFAQAMSVVSGGIQGGQTGAAMTAKSSGGNPYAIIIGAIVGGGIGGVTAINGESARKKDLDHQIKQAKYVVQQFEASLKAAEQQEKIARIGQTIALLQSELSQLQLQFARENLSYQQLKQFNAELWYNMAKQVKKLSKSYLKDAVAVAFLMERAYEFETGRPMRKIRFDYDQNQLSGLLAGDYLMRDIESFEFDKVMNEQRKEVPIKRVISLASSYPLAFIGLLDSGRVSFATSLEQFDLTDPGTYQRRIKDVEVIVEALLPPAGIHGTLTNGAYSMTRVLDNGAFVDTLTLQQPETFVLSKYALRDDRLVFEMPREKLGIFENTGVATQWTLEIPKLSNNFDYRTITDVKLVIYYTALFDEELKQETAARLVAEHNADQANRTTVSVFKARYDFPDEFYHFINTPEGDSAQMEFDISDHYFPQNELKREVTDACLVFAPNDSLNREVSITAKLWQSSHGASRAAEGQSSRDEATFGTMAFNDGFDGVAPSGKWKLKIAANNFKTSGASKVEDVWLCIQYKYELPSPPRR